MRSTWLLGGLLTIGLGAVLGAQLANRADGQVGPLLAFRSLWPPDPDDIVNERGEQFVATGQKATIYQVPAGETFVLTDAFVDSDGNSSSFGAWFDLVEEDAAGTSTIRFSWRFLRVLDEASSVQRLASVVGLKFAPGSKVILSNIGNGQTVGWNLIGYRSRR